MSTKKIILILIALLIGVYFIQDYLSEPTTVAEVMLINKREQKRDAALNAEKLVKRKLKSPSTAMFPPTSTATVTETIEGNWLVTSYVDSQNGFGAMIRQDWVAEIRYLSNDQIELVNIHFQ